MHGPVAGIAGDRPRAASLPLTARLPGQQPYPFAQAGPTPQPPLTVGTDAGCNRTPLPARSSTREETEENWMDDVANMNGPFAASPTVRHCDPGDHPLGTDQPWWLITDTTRGWLNDKGAACGAHVPAAGPTSEATLYHVGGMFDPTRTSWPEGTHLWLDNDGDVRLGIFYADPHPAEIAAVHTGTAQFAWTEQQPNGFLLFQYGDSPWNDAPFNPQRLHEPFRAQLRPRGTHSRTATFLVDADTGRIAAMRAFSWPAYFLNHVIESVRRLAAAPYAESEAAQRSRTSTGGTPTAPRSPV